MQPRLSNNIRVGGRALGAHSSLHSLRPPLTFPMEDRQRVINHQLPPTQATMGKGGYIGQRQSLRQRQV